MQNPSRTRRGAAAVAMVMVLIIVNLIVVHMAVTEARDHDLTVRRLQTIQAFYAAEAGMHMSMREVMEDSDEDADTGTGTISNDGNSGNDPAFGDAQVVVTASVAGGQTTLTSAGRSGEARRKLEAVLE